MSDVEADDQDQEVRFRNPTEEDVREFLGKWQPKTGTLNRALLGEGVSIGDNTQPMMLRNALRYLRRPTKSRSEMCAAMREFSEAWTKFEAGRLATAQVPSGGVAILVPPTKTSDAGPMVHLEQATRVRVELSGQATLPGVDTTTHAADESSPAKTGSSAGSTADVFNETPGTTAASADTAEARGSKPEDRIAFTGLEDIPGVECLCRVGRYWLCRVPLDVLNWDKSDDKEDIDDAVVDQIARSIGLVGQLYPVLAYLEAGRLDLIGGRHRMRGGRQRGERDILALVTEEPDPRMRKLIALAENAARTHDAARRDRQLVEQDELLKELGLRGRGRRRATTGKSSSTTENVTACNDSQPRIQKPMTTAERVRTHRAHKRLDAHPDVSEAYKSKQITVSALDRIIKRSLEEQPGALQEELARPPRERKNAGQKERHAQPREAVPGARTPDDVNGAQAPAPENDGAENTGSLDRELRLRLHMIKRLEVWVSAESPEDVADERVRAAFAEQANLLARLHEKLFDWVVATGEWHADHRADSRPTKKPGRGIESK